MMGYEVTPPWIGDEVVVESLVGTLVSGRVISIDPENMRFTLDLFPNVGDGGVRAHASRPLPCPLEAIRSIVIWEVADHERH